MIPLRVIRHTGDLAHSLGDKMTTQVHDSQLMFSTGTRVEVRRRFDNAWAKGFEVHATSIHGYRLRRLSDGAILPVEFPLTDVRSAG